MKSKKEQKIDKIDKVEGQNLEIIKEIIVPDEIGVFEDSRTKAKTVAFPFDFPDGTHAVLSITRLHKLPWQPKNQIKRINLYLVK